MISIDNIYKSMIDRFSASTGLKISEGTAVDNVFYAVADAIKDAYFEIEKNKTPHIYSKLSGESIDGVGALVGCSRRAGENDTDYLYRVLEWNKNNQTGNATAIENALFDLKYSNTCKFIPFTNGVGTGTVYIMPKKMSETNNKLAIEEVKERLLNVVSAGTFVDYVVPTPINVDIHCYAKFSKDSVNAKNNIEDNVRKYINNISPGDKLEVGYINKIAILENNVEYFSASAIIIGDNEMQDLEAIQKRDTKFVFNSIVWNEVE